MAPQRKAQSGQPSGVQQQAETKELIRTLEKKPENEQPQAAQAILEEFIEEASQPDDLSAKSCIKLCYFVELCRKSSSEKLRQVAYSEQTCSNLLNFFIDWSETNQHRSMRQVLEVITTLISNHPNPEAGLAIKTKLTGILLSIINHQSAQPLVKPAFKAFDAFLTKKIVTASDLVAASDDSQVRVDERTTVLNSHWDTFILNNFDWMHLPHIAPGAGKFLMTLFLQLRDPEQSGALKTTEIYVLWQSWILKGLQRRPESLEYIKNYLLTPLFRADKSGSVKFLKGLVDVKQLSGNASSTLDAHSSLLLAALEVGKKSSLVEEPEYYMSQNAPRKNRDFIYLPEVAIGELLGHPITQVRSTAFSVLISSSSPLKPFPPTVLRIFRENLASLYADTDAKFRNEILSSTRHLVERLRGSMSFMNRELGNLSDTLGYNDTEATSGRKIRTETEIATAKRSFGGYTQLLADHIDFLKWYVSFLYQELVPTASYQRHVTALRALQILLKSGILPQYTEFGLRSLTETSIVWPYTIELFNPTSIRLLLDLLMDPFEDVRGEAQKILKYAPASYLSSPSPESSSSLDILLHFVNDAQNLASLTGRADIADGTARAGELFYELLTAQGLKEERIDDVIDGLEQRVSIAEANLGQAVVEAPIHSEFASISLIWETIQSSHILSQTGPFESGNLALWHQLQERIIASCERIWAAVSDVLCNDSPEGHLPQDLDDQDVVDTKDVLSYSFRAIHESSNLLGVLVSKATIKTADGSQFFPFELFERAGNLSFEQLARLRHRGAFSGVSLTFAKYCQATQNLPASIGSARDETLHRWYKGTLNCIHHQVSTTRRSAGIPLMITAILSANAPSPSFKDVMEELKEIARKPAKLSSIDETALPQVHAMNCLKEVFKSSLLGRRSEPHIADGLQLATDSLQSEIWAIRNCGLILLRSLLDCLFGTSESKQTTEAGWDGRSIRLSYDKYPSLPDLLLSLLRRDTEPTAKLFGDGVDAMESVFPALDIIRRAGPPDRQNEEIFQSVEAHLHSKVWHVRDIAARTVCTLILNDKWINAVRSLFEKCTGSANYLHGVLLVAKNILEKMPDLDVQVLVGGLPSFIEQLKLIVERPELQSSPDLQSAYHEVINALLKTLLNLSTSFSDSQAVESLKAYARTLFPENQIQLVIELLKAEHSDSQLQSTHNKPKSSALLRNAIIVQSAYISALYGSPKDLEPLLAVAASNNIDPACAIMETLLEIWDVQVASTDDLRDLAWAQIPAFKTARISSVSAFLLDNIAEILEQLIERGADFGPGLSKLVIDLGSSLFDRQGSPELTNAKIKISGSILRQELETGAVGPDFGKRVQAWGALISASSTPETDFDTRFAAVSALYSFYCSNKHELQTYLVPSLIALFDTLTDDDEEIRELGAKAVASIINQSTIPLTAVPKFAHWLCESFPTSDALTLAVQHKLTSACQPGSIGGLSTVKPISEQLTRATKVDDSLFVEEEQNLFIDEVREAKVWCHVLQQVHNPMWDTLRSKLSQWAIEGLTEITRLAEKKDCALGWASKPQVFAICMTVVLVATTLEPRDEGWAKKQGQHYAESDLDKAIKELIKVAEGKELHGLLLGALVGGEQVKPVKRVK